MNAAFLVAGREYRQITSTRSFWITLLAIPAIIVFLALIPSLYGRHGGGDGVAYIVLDRTGRYAAEIDNRIEFDRQRQLISALGAYAKRWRVRSDTALWGDLKGRQLDDEDAAAFVAAGGIEAALAEVRKSLPPDAKPFEPPSPRYLRAVVPATIPGDATAEQFGDAVKPLLSGTIETKDGPRPLALAAFIPVAPERRDQPVRYWVNGRSDPGAAGIITGVVLHDLRARMMRSHGLDMETGRAIEAFAPVTQITVPEPGQGANLVAARSALPLGLAYLLLMTIIVSGTMMLQSVIEERSNKLSETLLACISADDLMRGKLLGVGAVAATMVATWMVFAIGGASMVPSDWAEALYPSLQLLRSPGIAFCLLFYFVTGYLSTSIMFLSIGAMSDSMQDAQGYLVPLVFLLTGPFLVLVGTVVENPDGILPIILSWIPIYTPFAMLARLGAGVSPLELAGTAALLFLFIAGEFVLLGRVFRASLLRTGQPPKFRGLLRMMRRPAEG